ncbi:MAG TPA: glycosyltransferase family 2 protein [Coleofasciculaceae cyanobacterium]
MWRVFYWRSQLDSLLPIAVLFIECATAFLPQRRETEDTQQPRPKVAVLIPAHNEASGIEATLKTILPQLTDQDRLIVIADNCTDDTAKVVRQAGANAIEREDPNLRGKGYALDYGLRFIETDPPDVLVIVDADCYVSQGSIDKIARLADSLERPVQATYLMTQPDNPGLNDLISTLAVRVKNLVRPIGLNRLGLPCLLMGSGMALPWSLVNKISLAGCKTVDDMQLAVDLAIAGHPPLYCQEAEVRGRLMKDQAAKSQKARWEHGHLEMLINEVPRLLKEFVAQRRFDLLVLALELLVPPLSLLVMIWAAATGGALLVAVLGVPLMPAVFLVLEGLVLFISIIGAWAKFCRADIPGQALLAVPFYILWKIPLYPAFLVKPQSRWLKTERDTVNIPES